MPRRAAPSFDPDAPDPLAAGVGDDWAREGTADGRPTDPPRPRLGDPPGPAGPPDGVWVDPFDDGVDEDWVEPFDDLGDDSPTARADRAYAAAVDPATSAPTLRAVAEDLASWDVESLLAEAAVLAGGIDADHTPTTGDRPEVVVLRSLLRHPNRPEELADLLLRGWLVDVAVRSPWPAVVAAGTDLPVDPDLLVTAVSEACEAARTDEPPPWSLVLTAAAAARADGGAVHDLLALTGFPHDQPARLWPDADQAARGLPGGVRDRARDGAERLGWDGRRLPGLPAALAEAVHAADRRQRDSSFAATLELCAHGPVVVTTTGVTLPAAAAGPRPYVALIVGSHPVFRLKRDWPDRSGGATATAWSWSGPVVLETRGLGCDRCRRDRDRDKRYLLVAGDEVADVRLSQVQRVVEQLDERAAATG